MIFSVEFNQCEIATMKTRCLDVKDLIKKYWCFSITAQTFKSIALKRNTDVQPKKSNYSKAEPFFLRYFLRLYEIDFSKLSLENDEIY